MELTPCLGIGDCVMMKMCQMAIKMDIKTINVSLQLIRSHRSDQERFKTFIEKLLRLLFPTTTIKFVDLPYVHFDKNKLCPRITTPYIMGELAPRLHPTISLDLQPPFIIFHTKLRLESRGQIDTFIRHGLPKLRTFFKNFRTTKTIVIMGERTMEDCVETRVLGMISMYKEMMNMCSCSCNNVIDRTKDVLISGNPDFDDFVNDMYMINKADLNVTFGTGGPLSMCQAFSKNNLCYVGKLEIPWAKNNYKNLVGTIDDLILKIEHHDT
jgi:hypothetical protein